jgi:hypothetical protein
MQTPSRTFSLVTALAAVLVACGGEGTSTASYPYPPTGTVRRATTLGYGQIQDDPSLPGGCGLVDNRWNQVHAASGPNAERVFVEDLAGGTPAFGWQWVWPTGADVVTYPEVVCGNKPWDMGAGGEFQLTDPHVFQPARTALSADYHLAFRSTGTHNIAFSIWAVRDWAHPLDTLADEIMIWVDNKGMRPSGSRVGTVQSGATTFDVWLNPGQTDHSGGSSATWTYVAFVAQEPVLDGPLDFTPLFDYLTTHDLPGAAGTPILHPDTWVGSVELGTEIVGGGGLMEISGFSISRADR